MKKTLFVLLLIIVFACGAVFAADDAFNRADADKNGMIDKKELQQILTDKFKEYDKNNDGYIDKEEFNAIKNPAAKKEFKYIDKDKSRKIDLKEFNKAGSDRFDIYDINRDGNMSREEFYSIKAYPQLKFYF
ncbi:MAG: hypothetical protein C0399_02440 [Syntrophus sp. (in: bacteria)]|nr:hypothetical protein [Syntrophus sp. (in: bacteria)]